MRGLSKYLLPLAAIFLHGCIRLPHGEFAAISTRPPKAGSFAQGSETTGSDCVEYTLIPTGAPVIMSALGEAQGESGLPILGATITTEHKMRWPFRVSACADIRGMALTPSGQNSGQSMPLTEPPERPGSTVSSLEVAALSLISAVPLPEPPEILGKSVTGTQCGRSILIIPIGRLLPTIDGAVADALENAGSNANVIVDGSITYKEKLFLLYNSWCWEVEGTPAHSALLE